MAKIHFIPSKNTMSYESGKAMLWYPDVSQTTLDVAYQNNLGDIFHMKVGNNNKGFQTILEHTGADYHFVPATGVYYVRLAFFLHEKGAALSVVNALSIKRYIQMQLERNKSRVRRMPDGSVATP